MLPRYFRSCLTGLLLLSGSASGLGQDDLPPEPRPAPSMPEDSKPSTTSASDESSEKSETTAPAHHQPNRERRDLPDEGQLFIRSIALMLLPQKFDDEKGWGDEKRIQSGLNVDFDGGRLRTSRRWNMVNHGSWLQGSGELVDPAKTFSMKAAQLPDLDDRTQQYQVNVSAKMSVTGRQQQWNYGVMLWSISADATADINVEVTFDVKSEVVTTDTGSRLRFLPNVTQAAARLDNFKLHRISHVKGTAVKGVGELVEELIQLRIKRENKDLAARINKALQKKADHFEVPFDIGGWFGIRPGHADQPDKPAPEAMP